MRIVLILLCLCACQPQAGAPYPPGGSATCGAETLRGMVGQPLSAVPASGPWGSVRVARPGMAMTMDYSESRLTISVDDKDRITALTCS